MTQWSCHTSRGNSDDIKHLYKLFNKLAKENKKLKKKIKVLEGK